MPRLRRLTGAVLAILCSAATAHAGQTFDNAVAFGDSLSDNGNLSSSPQLAALFPGQAPTRFTTNPGKVAVELVAQHYGYTLQPSSEGGTDYAWGGALAATQTSEYGATVYSTQQQLNDYLA